MVFNYRHFVRSTHGQLAEHCQDQEDHENGLLPCFSSIFQLIFFLLTGIFGLFDALVPMFQLLVMVLCYLVNNLCGIVQSKKCSARMLKTLIFAFQLIVLYWITSYGVRNVYCVVLELVTKTNTNLMRIFNLPSTFN